MLTYYGPYLDAALQPTSRDLCSPFMETNAQQSSCSTTLLYCSGHIVDVAEL